MEEKKPAKETESAVVLDIETVPDLDAARRLLGFGPEAQDQEVRAALTDYCRRPGQKDEEVFVKPVLQKIVAISVILCRRTENVEKSRGWEVLRIATRHTGHGSERDMLERLDQLLGPRRETNKQPCIIGWNTAGFDLPLARLRAVALRLPAQYLAYRKPAGIQDWKFEKEHGYPLPHDYWRKYADCHVDLMEIMANWGASTRYKLVEMAAAMGLPGKADGVEGSMVEPMVNEGRIEEVGRYCEGDVGLLYGAWLRYQLACGHLNEKEHAQSWKSLADCARTRGERFDHLQPLLDVADIEARNAGLLTAEPVMA
ncbi:3'-5' exonuclease family protein [Sabulicella rubraurantiaca]|uniref:hypothetical protein n=1 Tax=Sabulicella rubraurantiaca TaxID=2811429 RepID=UPI001A958F60|nr:hypothetical protein [Sabulicella rubraurantiaca]